MAWNGLFGYLAERSALSDYNKLVDEYMNRTAGQGGAGPGLLGPMDSGQAPYGSGLMPWQQQPAQQAAPGQQFPQEFYARAGGIPGYEHLTQGMQQNAGAMERLTAQNTWESQNMTAAQAAALAEQQRQWGAISPYQQSGIDLSNRTLNQNWSVAEMQDARAREMQQEAIAARRQQFQLAADAKRQGGLLGKIPEGMGYYETPGGPRLGYQPGAPGGQKVLTDINQLISGLNAMDTYKDYVQQPSLWSGWTNPESRGRAATAHGDIISALGKSRDLGTMQKSDIEFVSKNLMDPGGLYAGVRPGSRGQSVGTVDFAKEKMLSGLEQLARQYPELYSSPEAGAWRNYVADFQAKKKQKRK